MGLSTLTLPRGSAKTGKLKVAAGVVVGLFMLLPVAIAIHAGVYDSVVDNALSGWGMWGTFAIYASTRPSRKEITITVSIALALRLAYNLAIGEHGYPGSKIIGMGVFLGLAGLTMLVGRSIDSRGEQVLARWRALAVTALLSYIGVCLTFYISFAKMVLPLKLDYFLYNFDASLGIQPSFAAANLTHTFRALYWIEAMVYNSLGFWFAMVYAVHAFSGLKSRISILTLFIANAFIGFSLYFLFPAMGPKYAFPSFPALPGQIHPAAALLSGVPNAMPSLHFGGTLLICWLSQPWKWFYRITLALSALTALATLGLGEHYFIDLVVAVPYALAIFALSAKTSKRRVPLAAGSAMVILWLCFLRTGLFYSLVSWALVVATLVISFKLKDRLAARVWIPAYSKAARP
jgi:hypothetical protein